MACNSTVEQLEAKVDALEQEEKQNYDLQTLQSLLPYVNKRVRCGLDANDEVIPDANCVGLDVSFGIDHEELDVIVKIFEEAPDYGWPWAVASLGNNVLDTLKNPTFWLGGTAVTLASHSDKRGINSTTTSTNTSTVTMSDDDVAVMSESFNSQTITDTVELGDLDNIGNTDNSTQDDSINDSQNVPLPEDEVPL